MGNLYYARRQARLLFCTLICCAFSVSSDAQSSCEPNIDFELGTTSFWNYWRGTNTLVSTTPIWTLASCTPAPGLHTLVSSGTDYYGGFPVVGEGLYSLKIGKDSGNTNADGIDYHIHVPTVTGGSTYALIYRYAIVMENPGHAASQQPRFQINVIDSATGATIPCSSYSYVSSGSLPGFSLSTLGSTWSSTMDVWYKPWTSGCVNFSGKGGRTLIVSFRIGGCTNSCHFGYAYIDMNCSLFNILTVGCSGGTATLSSLPGYSAYTWTDSLTYTKSYGTTQTVTISIPTVTTTYAVISTPYAGYGCKDTFYTRLVPSNMVSHQAHDTTLCYGASVKIWGGATDILPITYSWMPATGLSCTTCDTTLVSMPPVGVNSYRITTYNTGGCLHTDTIKVTVLPVPTAINGNLNVCLGLTSGLSDAVAGAGWTSSNTTVATVGSSSGVVSGNTLGTAIITYSFKGLCPVYATVTVNPLPSAITGAPVLCVGFTTSLTDGPGTGTWSSSNTSIATVGSSSGIVTGMSGGTAIITWAQGSTTCWTIRTVTVIPVPGSITGITTICSGSSTTLADAGGGTWASSNTSVATIGSGGVVTGVSAGTATISYTIGTGCYVTTVMTILFTPLPVTGTPTVCSGNTTALSDATPGGLWASSDNTVATVGSTSALVTGISPVSAIISYSLPSGCRATMTVTVNQVPNPISGTLNVCAGLTTGLSDILSGGTWTSSNPAIGSVDAVTGIVTGISAGIFTCTYTIIGTGCFKTASITVNPVPAGITGPVSVCLTNTITLSDATTGGTWGSSVLGVASIGSSSGLVMAIATGTTTISYMLSTGCYATTGLTVNSVPAITGVFKMCNGATSALSNTVAGGTWSSGSTSIAGVGSSTGVVSGIAAGTSVITYTLSTGCQAYATVTISPLPAPITGATTVCTGATTTLSDASIGGVWSSGNTSVATILAGIVTGHVTGSATITYSVFSTGCYITASVLVSTAPGPIGGIPVVCLGATTTLSNATTGGAWTSAATTVSVGLLAGTVTGIAAGTASVVYSLGGSCKVNATVTILPLPLAIGGTAIVCQGAATTLSDASPGGTWSSGSSAIATVSGGGIVSGIAQGTATISYTFTSTGCSVNRDVTVNPIPGAIGGTKSVCPGFITTLSDATAGGTWSSNSSAIASIGSSTGDVYGGTAGTATISYKLASTGCSISAIVTVNPLPAAISGPSSVCVNSSITLSDATTGGVWSSGSTTLSISSGGIVTGLVAGLGTVICKIGTGCFVTEVITINPLPASITGPTAVCKGSNITLSDATISGGWTSTLTAIATINPFTGVLTAGSTLGCTPIIYTLITGCQKTTTVCVTTTPSPILGLYKACVSSSVVLSNTVSGGVWSCSPAIVGTIDATTGAFYGVSAGTATVTYSLGSGCTVTMVMTVNPLPSVIAGAGAICVGQTLTLSDGTPGGYWTSGSTAIATLGFTSGIVTGISPGTATITYFLGCIVTTTVTVNLSPLPLSGPATVCQFQTITLSDAMAGGTWTSSNPSVANVISSGTNTGDVTGNMGGIATITYTIGSGCSATKNVTVNPVPNISGSAALCTGHTTTLLASILFGTWSSSSTIIATVTPSTGVVTGVNSGTTVITYTLPTGCSSTYLVNVSSSPAAIIGSGQVCVGSSITLSDASGGGVWSSSNTILATVSGAGVVNGILSGAPNITYTLSTGCFSTIPVTVNPLPLVYTVTGGGGYCTGDTGVHITQSGSVAGNNYQLYYGGIATGTAISGTGLSLDFGLHTSAGTYKVVATDAITACSNNMFDSAIITINPVPLAITGTTNVCTGLITTLSDGTISGTWSSSNTALATVGASGIVTGVANGTPTITYALSTGCMTTASVVVNPLPVAITGATSLCAGLTTTLSDGTSGGTWSSGSTIIATIVSTTGTLTGVSAGTSVITYTLPTGCIAAKAVTVNPLPSAIAGITTVCVSATTGLSDLSAGGTWNTGNTNIASITTGTGVVSGVSAGAAVITYTLPAGCIAIANVTVNPLPFAGTITGAPDVCPDSTITLSDTITGGIWSGNNANATVTNDGVVTGVTIGIDTIIYSVTNVCGTDNAIWPLNIVQCDFSNVPIVNSLSELQIFPNPNSGIFTVNIVSDIQEEVSIVIVDMMGENLKKIVMVTNKPLEVDLSELHGVYVISMMSAHGKCSKKVTVNP